MRIGKTAIENFLAIGREEINFANQGLVLIQGVNEGNPSARSNGAGKSSLVDAVCWCLYGATARDVAGDAVIRRGERHAAVTVTIEMDDGSRLVVARRRQRGKGGLSVSQHAADGTVVDLTLGTERLTQERLVGVLGCPYEVFRAAVYLGQEGMPDLPALRDKALKELIEEAAGVGVIERAYEVARERHAKAAKAAELAESRANAARADLETIELGLDALRAQAKAWDEEADRARDTARVDLAAAQTRLADFFRAEGVADEAGLAGLVASLEAEAREIHGRIIGLAEPPPSARRESDEELALLLSTMAGCQARVEMMEADLADLERAESCAHCGRDLTAEREREREDLRTRIAVEREVMAGFMAQEKAIEAKRMLLVDEELRSLKSRKEQIKTLAEEHSRLTVQISRRQSQIIAARTARERIRAFEKRLAEPVVNPHLPSIHSFDRRRGEAEHSLTEAIKASDAAALEAATASAVMQVFSPKGVRAHILDEVTPFLNARTAAYLDTLSDGTIKAVWTTLVPDSRGELRENFSIQVSHPAGEGFAGLSGGEKRKVRIACALALQDLVAGRAAKPFRLFVADEIDDALDDAGLERLMTLLNIKAKERETVLVISHRDLRDWIPQSWTVTNRGGIAAVETV